MESQSAQRKRIYISSSFLAYEAGGVSLTPLRLKLQERGARLQVDVVLAEQDAQIAAAALNGDHMQILEGCARLAGSCDAFFGILFERHGTRIELSDQYLKVRAEASFFEAELLEACMTETPALIVSVRGVAPSAAMKDFLSIVATALGSRLLEADEEDIVSVFDDFCRAVIGHRNPPSPWLLDPLTGQRAHVRTKVESTTPKLVFLNGIFREQRAGGIEINVVRSALARAKSGFDDSGNALGQIAILSYLWLAIREFAKSPKDLQSSPIDELVQETLELWNASAAWYGMHGMHPMGCAAALNELTYLAGTNAGKLPHGARASAYYSIGARLRTRSLARRFFRNSAALATLAIEQSGRTRGFSMRASALARLSNLGEPLQYFDAMADYRREMQLRARHGTNALAFGEIKTE